MTSAGILAAALVAMARACSLIVGVCIVISASAQQLD
jgi:hypothetical protein